MDLCSLLDRLDRQVLVVLELRLELLLLHERVYELVVGVLGTYTPLQEMEVGL